MNIRIELYVISSLHNQERRPLLLIPSIFFSSLWEATVTFYLEHIPTGHLVLVFTFFILCLTHLLRKNTDGRIKFTKRLRVELLRIAAAFTSG